MGAGAGYTLEAKEIIISSIHSIKLNRVLEAYTTYDTINFEAEFDTEIDCIINDISFESYEYGDSLDVVHGIITKLVLSFENTDAKSESDSDIAEWIEKHIYTIREELVNDHFSTNYMVGGGYIHTTFDGYIVKTDDMNAVEHPYYYVNDNAMCITAAEVMIDPEDKNIVDYIDRAVTGENMLTEYTTEDNEEFFDDIHAAIEYAKDNGYDKVYYQTQKETVDGDLDTIDYGVAWRDEDYYDEFSEDDFNESLNKNSLNEANTFEYKEILKLAKEAGFTTVDELNKFKKEHNGEDLIKALRNRVGSNKQEARAFKVNYKDGNVYASKIIKASSKEAAKKIAEANGIKNIINVKSMDYAAAKRLGFDFKETIGEGCKPIKEDSANGSVYDALYDTIQDAYDPVTYDEAEYAIETAYEDGDIDEEEYDELMQELDEARNNADKFNNEQLDELGKKFGLDYMFYKDRGEDVMLYAPDIEDYDDEDAYEEQLEAFDDFLHYIEIDLDGDTEYFSETVTILHR